MHASRLAPAALCSALVACVACGGGGKKKDATAGRLRVADGRLLDGDGRPVALQGLGLGAIDEVKAGGHWNAAYFAGLNNRWSSGAGTLDIILRSVSLRTNLDKPLPGRTGTSGCNQ
jgi:hypothetical protein